MLTRLSVSNFAIIDELQLRFEKGLTIITGETGAGKSILLGALKLVLGERADLKLLKNEFKKGVIEAHFGLDKLNLESFFEENDLDYEAESILRRELLPNGKSRAFVNDTPVTLDVLHHLSEKLIDIHSQFSTENLLDENYQLQILDAYAGQILLVNEYRSHFAGWNRKKSELSQLRKQLEENTKETDYRHFLLEELNSAKLREGEWEELEKEQNELQNIDEIRRILSETDSKLDASEFGVIAQIHEMNVQIQKISGYTKELENLYERLNSVKIELEDIRSEIHSKIQHLESDPERLTEVNERLDMIHSLLNKHRVNSVEELLRVHSELEKRNSDFEENERKITGLEREISEKEKLLKDISSKLSSARKRAVPLVSKALLDSLTRLGMENSTMEIRLEDSSAFSQKGSDRIDFLFSANKGSSLKPIGKAVSGGERSRLMLAVKKLLAGKLELPTLILDEVDAGVSGKIADEVGNLMKEMAENLQLISITHLPQVAAKGNHHFKVQKKILNGATTTEVKELNAEERIQEIAELISGSNVSENAIRQSRELLGA